MRIGYADFDDQEPVTVFLAGDVSGARDVAESANGDYASTFEFVREAISQSDIAFCNFECSVGSRQGGDGKIVLSAPEGFPLRFTTRASTSFPLPTTTSSTMAYRVR